MTKKHENKRNQQERDALIIQYRFLPNHVAKKLMRIPIVKALGFQDAEAAGFLGLIRAAEIWDETRKVKFKTYAHTSIQQRIIRAAEVWGRQRGIVPGKHRSKAVVQLDRLDVVAKEDRIDHMDWGEVDRAIDYLPPRWRKVVRGHTLGKQTLGQVGNDLGVCKERVRQLEEQSIKAVRDCVLHGVPIPTQDNIGPGSGQTLVKKGA